MNKKILLTFTSSIFLLGIMELIVSGLLEPISTDLKMTYSLTGQLITVYAVSFALFGPFLIKVTQKLPDKPVMLISMIVFIIGNVVFAMANGFIELSIGRVITAMAAAVIIVKILDITVVISEPHKRGRMLALVYLGFSAANVFGIPISTFVGTIFGWRTVFYIISAIAIILIILLSRMIPDVKTDIVEENTDKIKSMRNVMIYISITMTVLVGNFVVIGYISPLLTSNGYSIKEVSLALLIAGLGGMTGTYFGGSIADKIGARTSIMIMLTLFLITMIIMPFLYPFKILFYITLYLWNVFEWSTGPAIQMGLVNNVQGSASNVFSWNMSSLNLGIGLGAVFGGLFITYFNIDYTPWLGGVVVFIGIILATMLKEESMVKYD
ncbi:MFS transporter [Phocicoccus pinnipedialis]|uniref:Purine efflux pump PbuE n=1 Tax=Phocicoccus pinnipedialis TaxID=110845 RepID=A0A6V7RBL1_9BACL|nr:MFS transporter [Jeotgalicoccus pinnipedialis]MBP1939527.1 putative MFS family arabinose efflux permease [Jeotgalicoccus pinnipedialis]CAD2075020.1 Purine efflux pump PbuE [Jeotgalicoccus pinnipedialis]